MLAWKEHRGEYGRVPALKGLRARLVDLLITKDGKRSVPSRQRSCIQLESSREGFNRQRWAMEKAFQAKEKTWVKTLKVLVLSNLSKE